MIIKQRKIEVMWLATQECRCSQQNGKDKEQFHHPFELPEEVQNFRVLDILESRTVREKIYAFQITKSIIYFTNPGK